MKDRPVDRPKAEQLDNILHMHVSLLKMSLSNVIDGNKQYGIGIY